MEVENYTNEDIADLLARIADLLKARDADRYRVAAYGRAARIIGTLGSPAAAMAGAGAGLQLEDLPDIGKSIAGTIREYVHTGRSGMLERLERDISPERLFATVPGIGEKLACRIHAALDLDTLEELELAAHEGRLAEVQGIGARRMAAIRDSVGGILNRASRRRARRLRRLQNKSGTGRRGRSGEEPSIAAILEVDQKYRREAGRGSLKTISPRRFNPAGKSWLPILHSDKEGWHFTALFSNTARAHELRRTGDWVVILFERDGHESQCTVVTEPYGPLQGRRVVRGREKQCRDYYSAGEPACRAAAENRQAAAPVFC